MVDVKKLLWKNDRDFNKEEIRDQRYFLVAEHNDLITKARHDLSARELKIMDYVVSKIKPTDEHFNVLHTSMYELTSVLNLKRSGTSYSQLAKISMTCEKRRLYL